jgi:hypothetical protein
MEIMMASAVAIDFAEKVDGAVAADGMVMADSAAAGFMVAAMAADSAGMGAFTVVADSTVADPVAEAFTVAAIAVDSTVEAAVAPMEAEVVADSMEGTGVAPTAVGVVAPTAAVTASR